MKIKFAHKKQSGFMMLDWLLWSAIVVVILTQGLVEFRNIQLENNARIAGSYIAQYNSAVSDYLDDVKGTLPAGTTTYTGTDWLKAGSCPTGSAARSYLACGFPDVSQFGVTPTTVVVSVAGDINATTSYGVLQHGGGYHGVFSNLALTEAKLKQTGGVTVSQAFQITPSNALESVADTHISSDAWWRLDGGNTPIADMDLGGNSFTDINCVGFDGADICRNGAGNLTFGGANVAGVGNLNTNSVNNAGALTTDTLTATQITASSQVTSSRYIDRNNTGYRVDPNGASRLVSADVDKFRVMSNAVAGSPCITKAVGSTSSGQILSCVSGRWASSDSIDGNNYSARTLGKFQYCALSRTGNSEGSHYCRVYKTGSIWRMSWYKTPCTASCF